jgi:hypothetical protein
MLATGLGSARMESKTCARDGARFEARLEHRLANVDTALESKVVSFAPNPLPGGPGLCIYVPQSHGGPVTPSGNSHFFIIYSSQGYGGSIQTSARSHVIPIKCIQR